MESRRVALTLPTDDPTMVRVLGAGSPEEATEIYDRATDVVEIRGVVPKPDPTTWVPASSYEDDVAMVRKASEPVAPETPKLSENEIWARLGADEDAPQPRCEALAAIFPRVPPPAAERPVAPPAAAETTYQPAPYRVAESISSSCLCMGWARLVYAPALVGRCVRAKGGYWPVKDEARYILAPTIAIRSGDPEMATENQELEFLVARAKREVTDDDYFEYLLARAKRELAQEQRRRAVVQTHNALIYDSHPDIIGATVRVWGRHTIRASPKSKLAVDGALVGATAGALVPEDDVNMPDWLAELAVVLWVKVPATVAIVPDAVFAKVKDALPAPPGTSKSSASLSS
jgi:hypothetical protein